MNDVPPPDQGSIKQGLLLTLALHAAAVVACCLIAAVTAGGAAGGLAPFLGIGLFQLLYVVPAFVVCTKKGLLRTRKGLALGAGITFLVNAACTGIVLYTLQLGGVR